MGKMPDPCELDMFIPCRVESLIVGIMWSTENQFDWFSFRTNEVLACDRLQDQVAGMAQGLDSCSRSTFPFKQFGVELLGSIERLVVYSRNRSTLQGKAFVVRGDVTT